MQYRSLGRSGLKVSPLCLGAMMFGGPTDEAASARIVDRARDGGVNFIDTADVYTGGRSEEIVGRAIAAQRSWWVLATKLANPTPDGGPNARGLSRRHAFRAVEASLRRLGTDVIDILYWHKEDPSTPMAESVRAMADLVRAGKIRYFGVSNHRAWRIAEICRLCDEAGIDRPVVSQPLYNALNRMVEVEHLPACASLGLGVFPYSPLARGVLTGKYAPDAAPAEGSRAARQDKRLLETEWRPESLHAAQTMAAHAATVGVTPGQFAIGWLLANRLVTGVITGPRTIEQWDDYVGALAYRFTAADEALVDGLVAPGHPSTPGYNDPAYPLEGRVFSALILAESCLGEKVLEVEKLRAAYGHSQVLFDLSLSVGRGELVTLLGRNGMGKTTTIRTLMGLLPAREGTIRFEGTPITGLPPEAVARLGVGLVPEGRLVFPTLTVRENLIATAANRLGRAPAWTLERVMHLFPRLRERGAQRGATLSGGEQQMLAIGRALMTNPKLLILDEATEGLAPLIRAEIWTCLRALKAEGLSILVVDKNLAALKVLADRHFIIEKGVTVWSGSSAELDAQPETVQRYLGV